MKNNSLVILIVEDSLQIVERMIPVLGNIENVRLVIHAPNYAESIKMIEEMNANVVILDINLPDKSGIEILKEIKKKHTELKVIMLSNHATENYKRLCSQLGADYYLDETAISRNIMDLLPKVIGETLYEKYKKVLETGQPVQTQEKMFWANGSELVFWINLFPIEKVGDKRLMGGEAINITDRVKTEKQLKSAVDRFTTLSNITSDAIWEWDMRTGIVYRNEKLKDLVGFSNMQNKHGLSWWFRRIHPEDRNRVSDKVNEAAEKGIQSWQDEYRFKCADGHYKYIYDRGFIVYENNVPIKMIGSLHDMTQVKQLEQKLIAEKLQKQKDITETIFSVQEKERTRIGHELHDNVNQILTTSKLFLDMISTPEKKHDDLKKKVSEYILLAIEEIRKLSKEMVTPQLKEDGLVTSITNLVEDLNTTHTLHILFHHQDDIEMLNVAKKVTLFRIIQEQVKNVLKYSQATHLTIHLHMHNENVELLIEDDGVGFDPTQTRRGIGLSNIYERTRFYNGEVVIDTAPGRGCKLKVMLPTFD